MKRLVEGGVKDARQLKARKLAPAFGDGFVTVHTLLGFKLQRAIHDAAPPQIPLESWQEVPEGAVQAVDPAVIAAEIGVLTQMAKNFRREPEVALSEVAAVAEILLPELKNRVETTQDVLVRFCALRAQKRLARVIKAAESDASAPTGHNRIAAHFN